MFPHKKRKYVYNFFLTEEEKQLIFTLKNLYRFNNSLSSSKEEYSSFINDMNDFYKNILINFSPFYAEKNQNKQESYCPDESGRKHKDYSNPKE